MAAVTRTPVPPSVRGMAAIQAAGRVLDNALYASIFGDDGTTASPAAPAPVAAAPTRLSAHAQVTDEQLYASIWPAETR